MSLLIKALQKAEQDKPANEQTVQSSAGLSLESFTVTNDVDNNELSLENQSLEAQAGFASTNFSKNPTAKITNPPKEKTQEAAATMFKAKASKNPDKSTKLPLILALLLLLVAVVAGGFYYYLQMLSPSESITPKSMPQIQTLTPVEPISEPIETPITEEAVTLESATIDAGQEAPVIAADETPSESAVSETKKSARLAFGDDTTMNAENIIKPSPKSRPLKVTRGEMAEGVNPNLLAAYQAFNQGNDSNAQRLYRKTLQEDIRNVDALLGMAAIASRQGRHNDAMGWYSKVMEVEPRNSVAQAAMVNAMGQADPVASESRIKSLSAQQPKAAHLQAALGSLYAEQNQWSLAQQAYFEAYHLDAKNPEYAFNLAVSLDQMGKQSLALQYYKEALALLPANGGSVDRSVLEARISALQ